MASETSSSSSSSGESACDEEELEAEYEDAVNEVVELQGELRAAEAEAKQLRMRLQAAAAQTARTGRPAGPALGAAASVVLPATLGGGGGGAEQKRLCEIGGLLEWLAEHVELGVVELLEVGFEVPIGGRTVHLRRVAQWPMPTAPGGKLRLSVPADHKDSIAQLLAYIKASGGKVDASTVRRFAAVWDLVPGELAASFPGRASALAAAAADIAATAAAASSGGADAAATPSGGAAEPSVLLAHRGCSQGILIATWPTQAALDAAGVSAASRMAVVQLHVGDRVEVEYEGAWFTGVFQGMDTDGKATVACDADPEGIITVAPLRRVRLPSGALAAPSATASPAASPSGATMAGAEGRQLCCASPCSGGGGHPRGGADTSSDDAATPSAAGSQECAGAAAIATAAPISAAASAAAAAVAGGRAGHRRSRSSAL